jgi:hypothetical protein
MEKGMMGEFGGQYVYRGTQGDVCRSQNNRSAILSLLARESGYQFVYHRNMGVVCSTQNNRRAVLSPPSQEPAIEKAAKYGMRKPSVGLVI